MKEILDHKNPHDPQRALAILEKSDDDISDFDDFDADSDFSIAIDKDTESENNSDGKEKPMWEGNNLNEFVPVNHPEKYFNGRDKKKK